ncbi:ubiquitin carboxyl-terminal hydrolase [Gaertneriomyces semiglobifer]|nr:ubiquitin carboxyl-terminal hydrolase [Gaertneriomyces semiglobifer]
MPSLLINYLKCTGVFEELAEKIGISGIGVEEVFALHELGIQNPTKPKYGLIFLFRWHNKDTEESEVRGDVSDGVYFMNQVVQNACATQALVSIALNCDFLDIGNELRFFKEFTKDFSPAMRGLALASFHTLRTAHNSFSRQTDLPVLDYPVPATSKSQKDSAPDAEAPFHFIAYVPINGCVWELDGLKRCPRKIGEIPMDSPWTTLVEPDLQRRMAHYGDEAVQFNLMAIVKDPLVALQERLDQEIGAVEAVRSQLHEVDPDWEGRPADYRYPSSEMTSLMSDLTIMLNDAADRRSRTEAEMHDETSEKQRKKAENVRRRYNYAPFIRKYIEKLHAKGILNDLLAS